jgi:hypothetical protein
MMPTSTTAQKSRTWVLPVTVAAIVAVGVLIIVLIVALTGPTHRVHPSGPVQEAATAPKATPNTTRADAALDAVFLGRVHGEGVGVGATDSSVINLGRTVCQAMNSGVTLEDIVHAGITSGFSGREAGVIAGVAIATYCPEQAQN